MTPRPVSVQTAKLTTQLSREDLITLDGLGAFAVIRPEPYGSQALIKLAWENLAVIAPRNITWTAASPATALYLHGYQPCQACDGKGITFGNHDQRDLTWDHQARRWRIKGQQRPASAAAKCSNRSARYRPNMTDISL